MKAGNVHAVLIGLDDGLEGRRVVELLHGLLVDLVGLVACLPQPAAGAQHSVRVCRAANLSATAALQAEMGSVLAQRTLALQVELGGVEHD